MAENSTRNDRGGKRHLRLLGLIVALLLVGGVSWWGLSKNLRSKTSTPPIIVSTFRDTISKEVQGPHMVELPAGAFLMGSPPDEKGRFANEGPQRTVTFSKTFAVGKYEVTWAEWEACVADGGCSDNTEKNYSSFTDAKFAGDAGYGRGQRPVINVDWDDAQAYSDWLTHKTGESYRLLSEAEWEYAARAGTVTTYFWGNNPNRGCTHANGGDMMAKEEHKYSARTWTTSTCTDGYGKQSAPVGSFSANAFGLYDMHGNVSEWTADCYRENYSGAPVDGSADMQSDCAYRVQRGGGWAGGPRFLRSAGRDYELIDYRIHGVGFRVARDMD